MSLAAAMPAAQAINQRIARDGHITVADFMALALETYYGRGVVFGRDGDFITAPEISQTFGEIIGLWCAVTWQQMGAPAGFQFIECGPGRGTLMADALRAAGAVPGFVKAAKIHLIERSRSLRSRQKQALEPYAIIWHDDLARVPNGPQIIIGNEFLDALPVRQFQRTSDGWAERVIIQDAQGRLTFSTVPANNVPIPIPIAANAEIGAIYEHSDDITTLTKQIAQRLMRDTGAALFIDYGHSTSALGETLQAVKQHRYHDVLTALGEADITAHVDFGHVRTVAKHAGTAVFGPVEQGIWLRQLGISVRQMQLARDKPADVARNIEQGVRRLTDPHGMGVLFKVIALAHPSLGNLEGFADQPA